MNIMKENIKIENSGIPELGNFIQFVGCSTCNKKDCSPADVLAHAGKVMHPSALCPHYENFTSVNITENYVAFWGGVFSNFYPCKIEHHGHAFKSSEQLFMYGKALFFNDLEIVEKILKAETPKEAKALGRKVKNFNDAPWNEVKELLMYGAVYQKFKQNPELQRYLINPVTETRQFVEGSPFDKIWGAGIAWDNPKIADKENWTGENLLGSVLDKVRIELSLKS